MDISEFYLKYTPVSLKSSYFDEEMLGCFETFGDDLAYVRSVAKSNPKCVWTMTDCDGGLVLFNGFHIVNRVYYMVTVEAGMGIEYYTEDVFE